MLVICSSSTEPPETVVGQAGCAAEDAGGLLHDGRHQPRIAHHGQVRSGRSQTEAVHPLDCVGISSTH